MQFQIDAIELGRMVADGSAVFTGHRPLGYVTNHVPLVTRYITRRWACRDEECSRLVDVVVVGNVWEI